MSTVAPTMPDVDNLVCGSGVITSCVGATIPMTDAGFELLVNGMVNAATSFIQIAQLTMAADMTFNQQKALNAGSCAVKNLGNNVWHFVAAVYYAARQFELEEEIKT
jgi:hypothetical protein